MRAPCSGHAVVPPALLGARVANQGDAPLVALMSCGREMTASIRPYSTASSAPMKKSRSVSCAQARARLS